MTDALLSKKHLYFIYVFCIIIIIITIIIIWLILYSMGCFT